MPSFPINVMDLHCAPILSSIFLNDYHGHHHCLSNVPIWFKYMTATLTFKSKALIGNKLSQVAHSASCVSWEIYGVNSGHFFSTLASNNLPFEVDLAVDTRPLGRALFKQFRNCSTNCASSADLLRVITASPITATVHDAHLIQSQRFLKADTQRSF